MTGAAHVVVYAVDPGKVAEFYVEVCGLRRLTEDDEVLTLGSEVWTLHLVRVPAAIAQTIELGDPPLRRSGTPIKLGFEVASLDVAARAVPRVGGQLASEEHGADGTRFSDVLDPEGNVVQLRQAPPA